MYCISCSGNVSMHSLEHDCIFENPEAMEHECQSSKYPLHVRVRNTEWDDE